MDSIPQGKPESNLQYQTYKSDPGMSESQVKRKFEIKFGHIPEQVFMFHGVIWAGPIRGKSYGVQI